MRIASILNEKEITLSCEVFPPKHFDGIAQASAVAQEIAGLHPSFMSVTYGAAGSTPGHTIAVAKAVAETGVTPLCHLTCVQSTREHVQHVLADMKTAGMENVLALRGDRNPDLTEKDDFKHASDLISYLKPKGDFCFLGACYPECHPESANKIEEIRHLKEKVNAGAEVLLSQLFFDNTQFYRFVEDCRIADINVPIVPGIMPVINAAQIKRMITMCGASFPERFQKIIHKFEDNKAALFDAGMSYALSQIIDLLANDTDGIHLYTMNNPVVARRICEGIQHII